MGKLKKILKGAGTVALAGSGVGVVAGAAVAEQHLKQLQNHEFKIVGVTADSKNPNNVVIEHEPFDVQIHKSDWIDFKGTNSQPSLTSSQKPVNVNSRTSFTVPGGPIKKSGNSGTFKVRSDVKTQGESVAKGAASNVGQGAIATKDVAVAAGKGVLGVAGAIWNKIKYYLLALLALIIGFVIIKAVIVKKLSG